jgi:hypothetical protein
MATIGATTLGEILPSSMGPTTLDAVADIVAPKQKRASKPAAKKAGAVVKKAPAKKAPAKKAGAVAKKAPAKKTPTPSKTNTGRKTPDGLVIWKGPRGGLFVVKGGKKTPVKK